MTVDSEAQFKFTLPEYVDELSLGANIALQMGAMARRIEAYGEFQEIMQLRRELGQYLADSFLQDRD